MYRVFALRTKTMDYLARSFLAMEVPTCKSLIMYTRQKPRIRGAVK